jgi:hypothetical protein
MGEKAQRQTGGTEFRDSAAVTEKAGSVPSIGVAEGPKLLVIASDKCGTGMHMCRDLDEFSIDVKT